MGNAAAGGSPRRASAIACTKVLFQRAASSTDLQTSDKGSGGPANPERLKVRSRVSVC